MRDKFLRWSARRGFVALAVMFLLAFFLHGGGNVLYLKVLDLGGEIVEFGLSVEPTKSAWGPSLREAIAFAVPAAFAWGIAAFMGAAVFGVRPLHGLAFAAASEAAVFGGGAMVCTIDMLVGQSYVTISASDVGLLLVPVLFGAVFGAAISSFVGGWIGGRVRMLVLRLRGSADFAPGSC